MRSSLNRPGIRKARPSARRASHGKRHRTPVVAEPLELRRLLAAAPFSSPNPWPVPGMIEAENFGVGGEDIAYVDLTVANTGGQYRPTERVDIEKCFDTGGGYNVGWVQPGEWLKYVVDVAVTGTYNLDIRAAYNGVNASGGTVHLESDFVDVSGPVALPRTGGWQTWQTASKTGIYLTAGLHVLKLAMDMDGAGSTANTAYLANINWFKLSFAPHAGDFDPSFGSGGIATSNFAGNAHAVVVPNDGKVIVGGDSLGDFVLTRFTADGKVDTTFGSGGKVTTDFGGADTLAGLALAADGGIVAAGTTTAGDARGNIALAKYTGNGGLFSGFGTGGKTIYDGNGRDSVGGVGIDGLGKVLVADNNLDILGQTTALVFRFSSTGAVLDSRYDSSGTEGDAAFHSAAATVDGAVLFGGTSNGGHFLLHRVDTAGTLTAKAVTAGAYHDQGTAVGGSTSGRIYLAGSSIEIAGGPKHWSVLCFDTSLNPRIGFGVAGVVKTSIPGEPTSLAVQRDGKVIVADNAALYRFNTNGTQDMNFGDHGKVLLSSTSTAIALNYDGRIAVGGTITGKLVAERLVNDSAPFGLQPAVAPGRIQAENFDQGGETIAWHDTDAVNQSGQYRSTGVDIESTTDAGGGYNLSFVQPSEWLKYTVNVLATGIYRLDVRVAYGGANANGGTFHMEVDGVDVTGPIIIPKTGGWQVWQTISKTGAHLTAGIHVLRLVFDKDGADNRTSGYLGNVNWFRLV